MATRVISAIVAIPLLVFFVVVGGVYMQIALMIVSLIGLNEFYKAISGENKLIHILGYLATVGYFLSLSLKNGNLSLVIIVMFILLSSMCLVIYHNKYTIMDLIITIFGFFYVPFLLSNILRVRSFDNGEFYIWLVFISAWACDTGAYFVGVSFGKHKLIPTLSPNKTVEGSIGGTLSATIVGLIYGTAITKLFVINSDVNIIIACVVITFFGSILAQFGDLTASAIKRYTKIKDFGKIMPGHGGVLDRFDSVVFTAPTIYVVLSLLHLKLL